MATSPIAQPAITEGMIPAQDIDRVRYIHYAAQYMLAAYYVFFNISDVSAIRVRQTGHLIFGYALAKAQPNWAVLERSSAMNTVENGLHYLLNAWEALKMEARGQAAEELEKVIFDIVGAEKGRKALNWKRLELQDKSRQEERKAALLTREQQAQEVEAHSQLGYF
ncbi:Hypothetical predicted protein [Lecanosticta acicola]|uniref:Uncharacterized protein n=1 Tax=Lecanosticta acicola TaxID=111012 RepID=A0AAI8Z920_9PEZI|nr:Hypothetical predicted protein [Lecanosticta acicola]